MDMVYYGEYYDARKEQPGWNTANFDEAGWEYAVLRKAPAGELVAQTFYADKVTERIQPVSIKKIENGNYLVDFGVEISGWVRLNQVEAPAGHKIEISFNGNQYSGDNSYIFKGQGPESYAPRFNWFVFSGVEIKNWPGELKPEQLTAEAVNTEVQVSANFQTSNELFNDINKIWRRSQIDNMHGGVASDCPHRERSPYTGDAQVACATVMHNYDAQNFYYKWMKDMADAQDKDSGYVPNCAPWQPGCGGGVAWGAAICIIPWEFYQQYGARDVLVDHYGNMKEYIRYMLHWIDEKGIMFSQRKGASGDVLKWYNLGEWVAPGELIRPDLVHTFYFWHCAKITGQTAEILGNAEESKYYHQLAEKTAAAFHDNFYDEVNKSYGNHGGNVFALRMGVPTERRADVLNSLEQSITKNDGHLDTGIFGTRFIFEVLAENGLNQLAYNAMNKTDEPSYGRWIALGSTTTREQWGEGGSHNHPMFGGGLVWFYRNLAGMQSDRSGPGYKKIIFRPQPVDELDFVRYENKTPHGVAGIHWINNKHEFNMELKVQVGSSATVYIPAGENDRLYENGVEEFLSENIRLVSVESDTRIYAVESGSYAFRVINGF
jgi:alpha-L-rhamnosidase